MNINVYIYSECGCSFLRFPKRCHQPDRRHASASLLSTNGICPTHTRYIVSFFGGGYISHIIPLTPQDLSAEPLFSGPPKDITSRTAFTP